MADTKETSKDTRTTTCDGVLDCYKFFLGIAQPTVTFIVSVFALITLVVVMINLIQTFALLSKAMKLKVKKIWFQNFRVCLEKFDVVATQCLPTDHELEEMFAAAKELNAQKNSNLLTEAEHIINNVPRLRTDKDNPTVDRLVLRTLCCRPEPSVYSFLSVFNFRYEYLTFTCEDYPYRFGYYYDYSHQKPVLVRIRKEESVFDYVCNHLKKKSIFAEQVSDKVVDLPSDQAGIKLKTVILALHIPFSQENLRMRAAFQSIMANTVDFASLASIRRSGRSGGYRGIISAAGVELRNLGSHGKGTTPAASNAVKA